MISIITPFYNASRFLDAAINSVINQSFQDWELILINDGSTDSSKVIALSYNDKRIKYFEQNNKGVSAARNLGLSKMKGAFFCFLDADDVLSKNSLKSRRLMFEFDSSIKFVDGTVYKMDTTLQILKKVWKPNFHGNPLSDLVQLTGKSFFGPSWMIKRNFDVVYNFDEKLTHAEDLFFYMHLAKNGGVYTFTSDPILYYRDSPNSATKNLKGLQEGYSYIDKQIIDWRSVHDSDIKLYRSRYKRFMFLAYLKRLKILNALNLLK